MDGVDTSDGRGGKGRSVGIPSSEPAFAGSRPAVLIVDDDPDTRRLVSLILGSRFTTLEAENGEKALKALERSYIFGQPEGGIRLVLLDVMMPGTDGITLCREIVREYGVKVVMLTARNTRLDVEAAIRNGACDYIVKPFSKDTLVAKVSRHLYGSLPN